MSSASAVQTLADESKLDAQNPWPGLTAFTEDQHAFFFGRSQETSELFRCVKRERLTVLFGKSGLGKTSLLQAGLFSELRKAGFLPVYIRLSYAETAAPLDDQLRSALHAAIEQASLAEVALPQSDESLWAYLHRRDGNLIDHEGRVVTPVLVFDQFEECFTLGARKEPSGRVASEFMPSLADLVENRTPPEMTQKLKADRELARRYDFDAPGCRILITLREDYLANLEALRDAMPSLVFVDNRLRLTEMTGKQAYSVVAEPNPELVSGPVADLIVRFVAGAHTDGSAVDASSTEALPIEQLEVAPAILSLFCRQLNEARMQLKLPKITGELVGQTAITIIDDFYKNCVADMHPAVRRLIEDRLLTKAGYRDNVDLSQARSDLEQAGAKPSCIDELVRLRLLQIEEHRGISRLELTHDVLAEPVKRSRAEWEEQEERKREQRLAQMARDKQQRETEEALASARMAQEEAQRHARFLRNMTLAAACVILLLSSLLVYGIWERNQAQKSAAAAQKSERAARASANTAERMRGQSEANAATAVANQKKAEENAREAERMRRTAQENSRQAVANLLLATQNQNHLTDVSSKTLSHCVDLYTVFKNKTQKESADSKNTAFAIYESLLMEDGQCLSLARQLHSVERTNMDVTDPLTFIPLRAAASALDRGDKAKVREYCDDAVTQVEQIRREMPSEQVEILAARTYMGSAAMLAGVEDDSAPDRAQRGTRLMENVRMRAKGSNLSGRDWDNLGDSYYFQALFLQETAKNADSIKPLEEAYGAELSAAQTQKGSRQSFYATEALERSMQIGDAEEKEHHPDEAMTWYQRALTLATALDSQEKLGDIYMDMHIVLVRSEKYDEASKLASGRIQVLSDQPQSTRRNRELAVAYGNAAEVEEAKKQFPSAISERKQVVKVLSELDAKAYDDRSRDLATAYGNLSFGEVEAGDYEDAVKDAKTGLSLDPSATWIAVNEAHGLLLSGQVPDARDLYTKIKDDQHGDHALKVEIKEDFLNLCRMKRSRPEMGDIATALGIGNEDLTKCLAQTNP